jgi:hypothetical protein
MAARFDRTLVPAAMGLTEAGRMPTPMTETKAELAKRLGTIALPLKMMAVTVDLCRLRAIAVLACHHQQSRMCL